ncbi:hypothetical protein HH212_26220 [Massilia forsythiae]|uniref:Uncharacterized protein n=1 Tax=Massilia forsythiae TaxID=2728020 RepID=A0A7Z2ZV72_9BURK|nr:hypothetical protein [Massilia forsythiae]QJE03055.1 hypothetical protein HH212_26220 [Massilia forsythiae]
MKIIMLSTAPGSVDGIRVMSYEADREYDLTGTAGAQDLAAAFVGAGLAKEVGSASPAPAASDSESAAIEQTPTVATDPKAKQSKAK